MIPPSYVGSYPTPNATVWPQPLPTTLAYWAYLCTGTPREIGKPHLTEEIVMAEKLRDKLIGAWTLVSYVEKPVNGSAPNHPMGKRPMGIIMYTPDGYMSAQLMRPDRSPFASGDWFKATPEEYGREASSYFAYSGPFHVDEEKGTVTHSVFVSVFPNWIGQTQILCAI